ncbi:MAG: hypothetical protein QW611_06445 [Ignisphaera sp.]
MSTFVYDKDKQQYTNQQRLAYEDLDLVRIYVYTFYQPDVLSSNLIDFMKMVKRYIEKILTKRYNADIQINERVRESDDTFTICININNSVVCIHDDGRFYIDGFVSSDMLRNIIETLGSMAYGVALALIELFLNNPKCIHECRNFVDKLFIRLNRVTYFPVPDLDAYNLVKDLFNKGAIPFMSSINIDYDTYREIKEKIDLVANIRLERIFDELGRYNIDWNILDVIISNTYNGIYIDFISPNINSVTIKFYISYEDEPKLCMNIFTKFSNNINREADIIIGWYNYVVKAIEKSIEKLDSLRIKKNIDVNKVNVLKDYLRFWLNIINRYRDEFEKNKVFT